MITKLEMTMGERIAEIISAVMTVGFFAAYIVMAAMGIMESGVVIMAVVTLILYGAFSICSFMPQWSNIMYKPETATPEKLHRIRKGCIAAKIILICAMMILSIIGIFI